MKQKRHDCDTRSYWPDTTSVCILAYRMYKLSPEHDPDGKRLCLRRIAVKDCVSPHNDPTIWCNMKGALEDVIMQVREGRAAQYSTWVASWHRREQVRALKAFTVPLGNLSVSYSVEPLLKENSDQ